MKPELVWGQAQKMGIKVLGITDHNSTANLPAFMHSAPKGLWVIPGMEVQTKEEVHLICLFPELRQAMEWGRIVRNHLPPVKNKQDYFGQQQIITVTGETVGEEKILLLNSISFSLEETIREVRRLGGVIYPAHIDRPSFSILSQLGFVPPNLELKVLEVSGRADPAKFTSTFKGYSMIRSSDAHYLTQIGVHPSYLKIEVPRWEELIYALNRLHHRSVITN